MKTYRKKPVIVQAMTFDEFLELGKETSANIVDGMPWSFSINGRPVTHVTDSCYGICTLGGHMMFTRGDMLIIGVKGEPYPCRKDIFEATYEATE